MFQKIQEFREKPNKINQKHSTTFLDQLDVLKKYAVTFFIRDLWS